MRYIHKISNKIERLNPNTDIDNINTDIVDIQYLNGKSINHFYFSKATE